MLNILYNDKKRKTQVLKENRINKLSEISVYEIEEMSVPDYGLSML